MAPRCQCDPLCTNIPAKGKAYCTKHANCQNVSPLSGSEHAFKPEKYNGVFEMQDTHNCFAYAFDYEDRPNPATCNKAACDVPFHQPGRKVGFPKWHKVKGKRCPDLIGRLKGDIPGLELATFTRRCPKGKYKVAVVVDPEHDYHFYRLDKPNPGERTSWSHKPGGTRVTRKDASNAPIMNPELADRDYTSTSELNYTKFCSYMCVPRKTRKLKRGGARRKSLRRESSRRKSSRAV